jgi:hypothetical protein
MILVLPTKEEEIVSHDSGTKQEVCTWLFGGILFALPFCGYLFPGSDYLEVVK